MCFKTGKAKNNREAKEEGEKKVIEIAYIIIQEE